MGNRAYETTQSDLLIEQLKNCASQFDVFRCLREITQSYGFRYFSVNILPRESQLKLSESVIITSAPSDLIKRHDEFGRAKANPVIDLMRKTGAPFEYRFDKNTDIEPDSGTAEIIGILKDYDLCTWLAIPVFTPGRGEAVISFIGHRPEVTSGEFGEISYLAAIAQDRLAEVSAQEAAPVSPLTDRELECIVWTAAGKTSVEIAKILGLSEHTVNHYLNNATRKSGTVNRTQTVAFALRNGWIE